MARTIAPISLLLFSLLVVSGCNATPKTAGIPPEFSGGQLLYKFKVMRGDELVSAPSLLVIDGQTASMECFEEEGDRLRIDVGSDRIIQVSYSRCEDGQEFAVPRIAMLPNQNETVFVQEDDNEFEFTVFSTVTPVD
ncbi:MAG TPA: hypothetical protein EYN79_05740 [Planctomycetes bacterium]|nr:hypothetical protein [Planctomycetota bacterium]HIN80526.1 hypothetical protein [Planctomycetota bacterium]